MSTSKQCACGEKSKPIVTSLGTVTERACFNCGGVVKSARASKESDNSLESCSTMDAALIARRFQEFRRAYRALESCLRSQGIDLKSE